MACLEVTVEILKAFGKLFRLDSDYMAEMLGFELSYLRGQLGDAGLYGTSSSLEGNEVNCRHHCSHAAIAP